MKHKIIRLILLSALSISLVGGTVAYAEPDIPQTRDVMPEVGNGGGSSKDDKDEGKEEGKDEDKEEGSGGVANEEEFAKRLFEIADSYTNHKNPDPKVTKSIIEAFRACGCDDYEITAYIINGIRESNLSFDMVEEGGGGGQAIWQWTGEARLAPLRKFKTAIGDTSNYQYGSIETQCAFLIAEMTPPDKKEAGTPAADVEFQFEYGRAPYPDYWKLQESDTEVQKVLLEGTDLTKKMTYEDFIASKDVTAMGFYFATQWERCGEKIDLWGLGGKQSIDMYELISNTKFQGGTDPETDKGMADAFVTAGLWKETDFVKWKTSTRSELKFADIQNLHNNDIYDVENWKADINKRNSESILIKGGRWLTILFGIIFNVWMLLIYISYWFDRLNNFFDYSLLNLLTFGRLLISPDEDECTFSLSSLGKGEKRTVNHRKVLEVVIIGLAFGTLIISGTFFKILSVVVNKILEILY